MRREWPLHFDVHQRKELFHQVLNDIEQHVALRESHLDIDLGKFRLTVSAQVFVAEAADDLVITVEAADHQKLFEELRRLRERVEVAVVQAAGNQVVARALRRGAGHERRLDFLEAVLVHVRAHHLTGAMAQAQVALHASAAQVEIAVAQARLFTGFRFVLNGEGRRLGLIQHQKRARHHFHFAGGKLRIHRSRRAHHNFPFHSHHVFGANLLRPVVHFRADGGIADDLRPARVVAQIEEDQIAEVAADIHPAGQENRLPSVLFAKLAAIMRSLPITKKV